MCAAAKSANRKAQILEEATHLFAANGFNGTPIRAIARTCGITEAAIYRHYDSKEHLYTEVIREKAGQHDITGNLPGPDVTEDLETMLTRVAEYILSFAQKDPELRQLMANSSRGNDPAATVLFQEVRLPFINYIQADLQQRLAAGKIRPIDPFITARCFVGMVMDCAMSVGVWQKLNVSSIRTRDVICNNMPIFARGLEVRPVS